MSLNDLILTGGAVGLNTLTGLVFDPNKDHTSCLVCGVVFQSDYDRNPVVQFENNKGLFRSVAEVELYALGLRKEWAANHAKTHSEREHRQLKASGRFCTPEAAHKLAAFGLVSLVDLVIDEEVADALAKSSAVPTDDAEGH